jgi:hypothetical protein
VVTLRTLELLRWHAGMRGDPGDPGSVSGAVVAGGRVDAAVDSFIDALQQLNVELNGREPSQVAHQKGDGVSRQAAYAVAEVSRMLRDAGHANAAWATDTAWLAVLAGDVDDVPRHVLLERRART